MYLRMSDPGTSRDLNLVLYCLMGSLLAPLATTYLSFLSMKTVFLVVVTYARRMLLELQALLANISSPFMPFHKDKVYLRSYPKSVPKIVSAFHLNQIIHLPVFFSETPFQQTKEKLLTLHIWRALCPFTWSEMTLCSPSARLFLGFTERHEGQPVTTSVCLTGYLTVSSAVII